MVSCDIFVPILLQKVARPLGDVLEFSTVSLVGGRTKQKMINPTFQKTDLLISTLGALKKLTTTGKTQKHVFCCCCFPFSFLRDLFNVQQRKREADIFVCTLWYYSIYCADDECNIDSLKLVGVYDLSQVHHVVLDEADTLFDDSFNEGLRSFFEKRLKVSYKAIIVYFVV